MHLITHLEKFMTIEGLLVLGDITECEDNVGKLLAVEYFLGVELCQGYASPEENFVAFIEYAVEDSKNRLKEKIGV